MKVLWLFNHPAPYKVDFFNLLGEQVDLTVLFERGSEKGRNALFYSKKAQSFKAVFLNGVPLGSANGFAFGIRNYLDPKAYDAIVINGWSTLGEMDAIHYLKKHKIPYIFAINGGIVPKKEPDWKKNLKIHYIGRAKAYLSPDERSNAYLLHYGAKQNQIFSFPYSTVLSHDLVSAPLDPKMRNALKNELGLARKESYVACGSLSERKNARFLVEEVWPKLPKAKELYLIGGGPLEKELQKFIKRRKIENVHLVPFKKKEEILLYFRMAEASIFLTKEDIYGHVVNESLSQGTPVLGSLASNASRKLIEDEKNGYLVSPKGLSRIVSLLSFPWPNSMREEALKTARENTLEKMVEAHLRFFERWINR